MSTEISQIDQTLSPQEQELIRKYKAEWEAAKAAGDQTGMDEAHRKAEAIRNEAGYSGGHDGNSYKALPPKYYLRGYTRGVSGGHPVGSRPGSGDHAGDGYPGWPVPDGDTGNTQPGQTITQADALEQWRAAAAAQTAAQTDRAVSNAVQQLLQAQQEANARYQTQRNQIADAERDAMDNSALYAELRGDRGGIGQAQYNSVQAAAAANRQAVNAAQIKLASDTNRQIADLRAQGEFEKADNLLAITQTYLLKLLELETWATETGQTQQQLQSAIGWWEELFGRDAAQL